MHLLEKIRMRLRMLFRRSREGERLNAELEFHIEQQTAEYIAAGMSPEEGHFAALRAFGNPTLMRDHTRENWSWNSMESLLRDVRYGIRTLARTPGFSVIAILVMALGIGSTIAMFTVVHSVLLNPLPYKEPDRIVRIYEVSSFNKANNHVAASGPDFFDWQKRQHSFSQMAIGYNENSYNLSGTAGQLPEHVDALTMSWNFYKLLGVKPALGRFFTPADDRWGANATVVLSWNLWKRRFDGDPGVLGKTILLDAKPYTVIGVMPEGTAYPDPKTQVWTPFFHETPSAWMQSRGGHNFQVVARLKPGVSQAHAQAEMSAIQSGIHQQYPGVWVAGATHLEPLLETRVSNIRAALLMLFAVTGCLLLIGCLNVANLLVARAATRRREAAIRTALGCGRWRLVREQIVESTLLCLIGGTLGLLLASLAIHWLVVARPDIPRVAEVRLDAVAVLAAVGSVLFCGLFAGLIPVLTLKERHILDPLQSTGRSQGAGYASTRLRRVLLSLEVALTVVLLVGAGLLLKSYQHLRSVNLGCRTHHILTMGIALPDATYKTPMARTNFYAELLRRVRTLPGVSAATLTDTLPGDGEPADHGFLISENPPLPKGQSLDADVGNVGPDYFKVMQIPLLKGRLFQPDERLRLSQYAIVSESFAQKYLPGVDPIGKHIDDDNFAGPHRFEIVGVVGDVRGSVTSGIEPLMYFPLYRGEENGVSLVAVTKPDPISLALPVQKIIAGMDPNLGVYNILTMDQIIGKSTLDENFEAMLVAIFATLSLVLAAVGLFGVLSYIATQRQGEIGIRIALGAQREQVLRLMLFDGMKPALLGLVLGLITAAAATRLIRSLLYRTQPLDAAVFVLVAGVLLAVAAAACIIPAWRASRLDPMQALRTE